MGRFSLFQKGICRLRAASLAGLWGTRKPPRRSLRGGGETVIQLTMTKQLTLWSPTVAFRMVLPLATAVTRPLASTVAILVSSMVQVTVYSVPSTRIWTVVPALAENSLMVSPLS